MLKWPCPQSPYPLRHTLGDCQLIAAHVTDFSPEICQAFNLSLSLWWILWLFESRRETVFCLINSINHILKPKGPKMYLVLAAFARWLILPRVVCVIISHSSGRSKQDWCLWTSLNWSRVSLGQSERNCEGNWWITCLWFELQTATIDGKLFFIVTQSQPGRHDRHNVSWRSVLCLYL